MLYNSPRFGSLSDIETDGRKLGIFKDPPGQNSCYIIPGIYSVNFKIFELQINSRVVYS